MQPASAAVNRLDCLVTLWQQSLSGLWTHSGVPAMQCPASHPWIGIGVYVPIGTTVPSGVDPTGLGPIGLYIPLGSVLTDSNDYVTGTKTDGASATNWTTGTNTYTISLNCTHNASKRYTG